MQWRGSKIFRIRSINLLEKPNPRAIGLMKP